MSKSVLINGQPHTLSDIRRSGDAISGVVEGDAFAFTLVHREGGWVVLQDAQGVQHRVYVSAPNARGERSVMLPENDTTLAVATRTGGTSASGATRAAAPMPGTVQDIRVGIGDTVEAGETVAVMEAMKMQIAIAAPYDGVVKAVCVQAGAQVSEGTELVQIEASDV